MYLMQTSEIEREITYRYTHIVYMVTNLDGAVYITFDVLLICDRL
jgi:hypothetical protein